MNSHVLRASAAEHIAPLDPLLADTHLSHVPEWNTQADTHALIGALVAILPTEERARSLSLYEACAAMRDIGIFLSSIRRHGVEPAEAVPSIVPVLLSLGLTSGMVPRDTVYHYGPWNPTGARERRFTRDANEAGLIHCVRSAAPGVESAILALSEAVNLEPESPDFTKHCVHAARSTRSMVESIDFARGNVDVMFFAKILRPYFESITLAGRSYMGAAAAHLPLCIVDHLTWGSDCEEVTYRLFQEDASRYTVPAWRELYHQTEVAPSLITRVIHAIKETTAPNRALFESAVALYTLSRVLLTFRGRHKVLADKAYDPSVRMYPVGSGGFSTDMLQDILDTTRERGNALKQAVKISRSLTLRPRASVIASMKKARPEAPNEQ